ncbi:hypothetical protein MKW92_009740 [Papaver armeniacum]|nr:hypothetical protein MKW92_009740 [Papaver armeniacum]
MSITELIFYRALIEPKFCPLYAFLCSDQLVNKSLPSFPSDVPGDTEITFNHILLNNCQLLFEREHMNATEINQQVMTGPVEGKTSPSVVFVRRVFEVLLDQNDFEVHVEAVCLLLITFGKKLDEISNKSRALNDCCFHQLKDILTTHPQLETRLKFMILDLLDVRANNWVESECKVKRKTILN